MANKWNIGNEAKQLDKKTIKERMKIERSSLKKIFLALLIYFFFLTIFIAFL
ncbi:MAG: hypothetical protein ACFFDK_20630 [Promethearchaeota archaeon]